MFKFGIFLAILFIKLIYCTAATDYCDPVLCENNAMGGSHIGCNNTGEFFPTCEEPSHIPLTTQMQATIIQKHNEMRNQVANGELPGFSSAKRMTTMTWDSDLAFLAKLNVLQCQMKHDECHNTFEYRFSGQNLGFRAQSTEFVEGDHEEGIVQLINEWFAEHQYANQSVVDEFSHDPMGKEIGHFTAMIQQKSAKIGCAYAQFKHVVSGKAWNAVLLACNYSFTNMMGLPIYDKGPAASGCKSGKNPDFAALCSVSEKFSPSPYDDDDDDNLPPKTVLPDDGLNKNPIQVPLNDTGPQNLPVSKEPQTNVQTTTVEPDKEVKVTSQDKPSNAPLKVPSKSADKTGQNVVDSPLPKQTPTTSPVINHVQNDNNDVDEGPSGTGKGLSRESNEKSDRLQKLIEDLEYIGDQLKMYSDLNAPACEQSQPLCATVDSKSSPQSVKPQSPVMEDTVSNILKYATHLMASIKRRSASRGSVTFDENVQRASALQIPVNNNGNDGHGAIDKQDDGNKPVNQPGQVDQKVLKSNLKQSARTTKILQMTGTAFYLLNIIAAEVLKFLDQ